MRLNKHISPFLLKVTVNGHTNPSREAECLPIDVNVLKRRTATAGAGAGVLSGTENPGCIATRGRSTRNRCAVG